MRDCPSLFSSPGKGLELSLHKARSKRYESIWNCDEKDEKDGGGASVLPSIFSALNSSSFSRAAAATPLATDSVEGVVELD
eukprot:CAMPEP_0195321002 /NCGR_PEP_ID=MMETSP0708-20121125/6432_1 /TAXON_ID=33640 /ORGANISM="Asterionellopsis glacialis, Strain CCMP134" /LENGTH=80 /DNA_ID=CAMNT_0040387505 /DNA_START=130 /DNA_END=369 /DNA_ORIENTATION=+